MGAYLPALALLCILLAVAVYGYMRSNQSAQKLAGRSANTDPDRYNAPRP